MGLPAVGTPCRVLGLGKLREGFIPDFPDIPEGGDRLLFGFAVFHGIEVEFAVKLPNARGLLRGKIREGRVQLPQKRCEFHADSSCTKV